MIAKVASSWRMALAVLLLLGLFWSLVYCQTFPYVSFMGQTLANHSYVDLSQVGNDLRGSDSVQCHTDLDTCCISTYGPYRGDWYFPDRTRLPFSGDGGGIFEYRNAERVDIRRRNSANSPTGIYRCDIPTIVVHDYPDRDTVYVGLYTGSGGMLLMCSNVLW